MKKKINNLIDIIEYKYFEKFSLFLLLFWIISPIIEYLLGNGVEFKRDFYWVITINAIGLLGILEYCLFIYKEKKDKILNKHNFFPEICLLLLLVLSLISSIFSKNTLLSFMGESYRKEGLIVYIMYIGIMLSSSIIRDKKYIRVIAQIIILSAVFITLLPLFKRNFTFIHFSNIYFNTNHYGYFLMISVMLSIFMFIDNKGIKRVIYGIIYFFLLYILIRDDTFGCYLAITITLLVLFIYVLVRKEKRIITLMAILVFIITSFFVSHYDIKIGERVNFTNTRGIILKNFKSLFSDTSKIINKEETTIEELNSVGSRRGVLWKEAFNYTLEHPLIGGGMECLGEYYAKCKECNNDRPHNVILQFSSFIGIPGTIIYIVFIVYLALKGLKRLKSDSVKMMIYFTSMCYFISSMFGNSMYYTSPYFMILLGLLIGINRFKIEND